jgi:GT2 family glycosyltransferase
MWPFPTTAALLNQYTALGWIGVGARDRARIRGERGVEAACAPVDYVSAACLVIRTDLFVRLGGFDPGFPFYFEDIDLGRRVRAAGFEVHGPVPGPPVLHKGGASAAVAGGALRLPLLQGVLRYQRRRLSPRAGAAFSAVFKLGVLARTAGDALRWPLLHALRRLRGSPRRVSKSLAAQRARLRFLERDLGRFLRS